MHEVSIAEALLGVVAGRVPAGMRLTEVHVEAGAWQQLDGGALEFAWRAVTADTALADSQIRLTELPWSLACRDCGRRWTSSDPLAPCTCGSQEVVPEGSAELRVTELEVEPIAEQSSSAARAPSG